MDLPIKDLQALRQQYVEQREDVKKAAELEERELNDNDVAELERLAKEIRNTDRQLKVKREDQEIAKSAVLAGESSRGASNEMRSMSKRFDLAGAVRDLSQGKRVTGVAAEFTQEALNEVRGSNVNMKGQLSIPTSAFRALGDAGEFGAGSTLANAPGFVPTNVAAGVEALASPTLFESLGGRVLNGLTGDVKVPIVNTAATISTPAEGAAFAADANSAIGSSSLSPQRYGAYVTVTEQLMLQGGAAVEQLITQDMVTQLNRQIDKAVFDTIIGTGDGDNTSPVSAAGMLIGEGVLAAAGVDLRNVVVVADGIAHALLSDDAIVDSVNAAIDRSNAGNFSALGYPYRVTDLLPSNLAGEGSAIMMDPNMAAVLGLFGGIDIVVNPYALDINHQVRISVHKYADAAVLHAGAAYTFHDNA
jgi:hypothetical protein